ncbi:hypothetical protein MP228_009274 [Amoeboaphelidium protococcarum]|nr:hypothetical protein MP228_009274 [Amoeboaphelidium protococcarum]
MCCGMPVIQLYKRHTLLQALLFPIKSYTFYIGIAAAVGTGTGTSPAAAVGTGTGTSPAAAAAVGAADFVGPAAAAVGVGTGTGTGSQRWLLNLSFSQVGGEN